MATTVVTGCFLDNGDQKTTKARNYHHGPMQNLLISDWGIDTNTMLQLWVFFDLKEQHGATS